VAAGAAAQAPKVGEVCLACVVHVAELRGRRRKLAALTDLKWEIGLNQPNNPPLF
jgi:hypothetical protein